MKPKQTDKAKKSFFYADAGIFETELSAPAKLVFLYLMRVADKRGVCYPSVSMIAARCSFSKNTARKAITELEHAGFLATRRGYQRTPSGHSRCTSNTYTLSFDAQKEPLPTPTAEPDPVQDVEGGGAAAAQEINNNTTFTRAHKHHSFYEDPTDPELARILDRLQLHLYEDKQFSAMIEHVIRKMYAADAITVKKQRIPQGAVRSVLNMLTINHIDFILQKLREGTDEVNSGEAYVMSCLYNAPIDCTVADLRFMSRLKSYA